jgi:AmmeMemoRadiSam system protein A
MTDFEQATQSLLLEHGELLLKIAAASILNGLTKGQPVKPDTATFAKELQNQGASFVTIKKNGDLRGCIGSPEAHCPLIEDVPLNAFKAGFHDPRFSKLVQNEIPELALSISVLSPASEMSFTDEQDLLNQLRPGADGLIIQDGRHRSLFLPSVWEQLPKPENFLSRLKLKAGMAANHWSETFAAQRFIAGEAKQSQLQNPASIWSSPLPNTINN